MYEGKLVTFKIKGREELYSSSLFDIDSEIDDKGLLLIDNNTKEKIGYYEKVWGISFDEMMSVLGYKIV